jgi:uncharacterized protein (DUF1330 family)
MGCMAAYAISETEVYDEEQFRRYRDLAEASIMQYGGRYLARATAPQVPEGEWPPEAQLVVIEFPDMARLREWYASPEYAGALALRQTALGRRLLFVEGVA